MKKAGIIVRLGFVALATTFCSAVMAQSAAKFPGRKDTGTPSTEQVKLMKSSSPNTMTQPVVVKSKLDPKLIAKFRGGVTVARKGKTTRNCTPKSTLNPWSITRENFNKMPANTRQYVLEHSNKYTIVD